MPDAYDRSGMWLGLFDRDTFEVIDIVRDGPAAKAGIRVGDHVTRVGTVVADPKNYFVFGPCSRHLRDPTSTLRRSATASLSNIRSRYRTLSRPQAPPV